MLTSVTKNKVGRQIAQKYIDNIPCADSVDDAENALEAFVEAIDRAEPQLTTVLTITQQMSNEDKPSALVSLASEALLVMDDLIENIIPQGIDIPASCDASAEEATYGISKIADLLSTLSTSTNLIRNQQSRDKLVRAEKVTRASANLIGDLSSSASSFSEVCSEDPNYAKSAFVAIANGINKIADLFFAFEDNKTANLLRTTSNSVVETSAVLLDTSNTGNLFKDTFLAAGIDCSSSFQEMSASLKELSSFLEELDQ